MFKNSKIYIAGHKGMVGSALLRKLKAEGYNNLVVRTSKELDLTDQSHTEDFFKEEKPDYVFMAAAKVGGITANISYPADFIYNNLMIQSNVLHCSFKYGVKKLLYFGSGCMYPVSIQQPMREDDLFDGKPEKTNEAFAIAKITGTKMCQYYNEQYKTNFISCIPANLYGLNDKYDLENSHVIPGLIKKIYEAKKNNLDSISVWGTGNTIRDFLYVDDLADACLLLMNDYDRNEPVNIGTESGTKINEIVSILCRITDFKGKIEHDLSKPDGNPIKVLDTTRIKELGWVPKTDLETGLKSAYDDFLKGQRENENSVY